MSRRSLGLIVLVAGLLSACGGTAARQTSGSATGSPTTAATTASTGSTGSTASGAAPAGGAADYLALGDSVSFGYREPTSSPKPNYADAASFIGYPMLVGKALGLQVTNAACPGETTTSFIKTGGASFGCESSPGGGPGYRSAYPLHVSYSGTQLAFATSFLKAHPSTKLVSLMIGANDGFLCEATTKDMCVSEVTGLFSTVQKNVATILSALRTQGGYQGTIAVVEYYSTDYSSVLTTGLSEGLNSAIAAGAQPYHVTLVDGLTAFKTAAASAGGKTCQAGLLTKLSTGGCGVHPSAAGQATLARAVESAVRG